MNQKYIDRLKSRLKAWEAEAKTNIVMLEVAPNICKRLRAEITELEEP